MNLIFLKKNSKSGSVTFEQKISIQFAFTMR